MTEPRNAEHSDVGAARAVPLTTQSGSLLDAARSLDAAWSDAVDAMDDDNIVPTELWQRWMAAHRDLRAALLQEEARHIVDLRADGWTIKHPLECRPDLFACQVNKAAERDLNPWGPIGKFYCEVSDTGSFALLDEVSNA